MLARLHQWYESTFGQSLLGAVLLWAALPPADLWPLAWIAPAWWVMLARRERLPGRHPYRALWLVGFLFWLAAYHWLRLPHWATSFGWLALAFYQAFYLPIFVGLIRVAKRHLRVSLIVAAPVVWTGLELARAHLLTGITMASLGHTQYHWIELIQISDLAGAYGVSFVVMLVAACMARCVPCGGRRWAFWPLVPAAAAMAATVAYGYFRTAGDYTAPGARIALIQGCVDTQFKSDESKRIDIYNDHVELSHKALEQAADIELIVWPETMFPQPLVTFDHDARKPADFKESESEFRQWVQEAAQAGPNLIANMVRELDTPLLLGIGREHYGAQRADYFNSAVFVSRPGKIIGHYDKMHRVLFGEYVPFAGYFPWLHRLTPLSVSITAGSRPAAFDLGRLRIAPNICYESVLPHVIRRQVNDLRAAGAEPDVLVNLTNDGWFWGSSELDMHLVCAVFRAVECRKPFLIAANTGFSAWIDGDGRILAQGPRRKAGVIVAEVRLDRRQSWYLRHGDWPAAACLAATVLLTAMGGWSRVCRGRARAVVAPGGKQ